jgi:predicted transcriptional regulator
MAKSANPDCVEAHEAITKPRLQAVPCSIDYTVHNLAQQGFPMSSTMTIRLEDGIKHRLDQLASVTQRSKSFLAAEAIAAYVDTNEWQLSEIRTALTEAQAQDYATEQDMADLTMKWNAGAH